MTSTPDPEPPVHRLKLLGRFQQLLDRLAPVGTDRAGNRQFLYSHYAALILFGYFNPAMATLRGLTQASHLKAVQKRLGVRRVSTGSLSESPAVFDPQHLVPILQELLAEVPPTQSGPGPHRRIDPVIPPELVARLVAVDGSALATLPRLVAKAGEWKLHLQFRPLAGLPGTATVARTADADELQRLRNLHRLPRTWENHARWAELIRPKPRPAS